MYSDRPTLPGLLQILPTCRYSCLQYEIHIHRAFVAMYLGEGSVEPLGGFITG